MSHTNVLHPVHRPETHLHLVARPHAARRDGAWRTGLWASRVSAVAGLVVTQAARSTQPASAAVVAGWAVVVVAVAVAVGAFVATLLDPGADARRGTAGAALAVLGVSVAAVLAGGTVASAAVVAGAVWAAVSLVDRPVDQPAAPSAADEALEASRRLAA